jgi:hypothetical protein
MARIPVSIPDTHELDWQPLPTARDGNVPGPVFKLLSSDPETGGYTKLQHMPPGWHDPALDYHDAAEEAFRLVGWNQLADRRISVGCYLYRPAGILHGPASSDPVNGSTGISRFPSSARILRYTGDEFPHVDSQPITDDYLHSPIEWVELLDSNTLPWLEAPGPWAGASYKWLGRNRETGGGALLIDMPPGWEGGGAPGRGTTEEFVIEGSLIAGGVTYVKWGYACRAPGAPAGAYGTQEGARLICYWDENELE